MTDAPDSTPDEVRGKLADALLTLDGWLRKHPDTPFLVVFAKRGDFVTGAEFGEEAPDLVREARLEAIREWAAPYHSDPAVFDVDDLYDRLRAIDANVMAGGAVYGAGDSLVEAIDTAIGGGR